MNTTDFKTWMQSTGASPGTVNSRVSNLGRIEASYAEDLDTVYDRDQCNTLANSLAYSTDDKKNGKPNPSRIEISGDLYTNLAMYRAAVNLYKRFREEFVPGEDPDPKPAPRDVEDQTFSLERDLQAALRQSIGQLEEGLAIIDDGMERTVPSGRIDILAQDSSGTQVVIELKAVRATRDAVGQILSYMGDIRQPDASSVRGILVAPSFDDRAISAARVVDGLQLMTYAYKFSFRQQVTSGQTT
jgi:hypothetical protein